MKMVMSAASMGETMGNKEGFCPLNSPIDLNISPANIELSVALPSSLTRGRELANNACQKVSTSDINLTCGKVNKISTTINIDMAVSTIMMRTPA